MIRSLLFSVLSACVTLLLCLGQAPEAAAEPAQSHVQLKLLKNLRSSHIFSPKSAIFSLDGKKFYINALEGKETLVYDSASLELLKVIPHTFAKDDAPLFLNGETTLFDYTYHNCRGTGDRNQFSGKPVECTFTHNGRYLWVSYYRRECDHNASSPSALAIIDTSSDSIVRVMPTAPLPKMVCASPDGKYLAVTNWGDNTVGLININSENPMDFHYERLLVVGSKLNVAGITGNRDNVCGLCLRGTVFTADGRHLLVAGMKSASLHVFEVESGKHLGSVRLPVANPRHFVRSPDGQKLYVSFNVPGKVAELTMDEILNKAKSKGAVSGRVLTVGSGARTVAVSNDGRHLYAACNKSSSLTCIDIPSWRILATARVAPYAVGLAVHPEEKLALVTSQGRNGQGGNNVAVFAIEQ
ncbi:MAG: YncE family protein [Desulfovibrio sp.]|nr:YncE family protein [Desulfovibrio sp.]